MTASSASETNVLAYEHSCFLLVHVITATGISEIKHIAQPVHL